MTTQHEAEKYPALYNTIFEKGKPPKLTNSTLNALDKLKNMPLTGSN